MKIGIFSDLHMEFAPWDFKPEDDVLYLNAGDTHTYPDMRDKFESRFESDCYFDVRGNHDYYGSTFNKAISDCYSVELRGVKIALGTLWSDLSKGLDWHIYVDSLADSRFIRDLTFDNYMKAHKLQKEFLFGQNADVIVTHHAPSYLSCAEQYKGNPSNPGFMTELYDEIMDMPKPPKLWIHGHVHTECDYMIGNTRVICHPRGYPNEMPSFQNYQPKCVEI